MPKPLWTIALVRPLEDPSLLSRLPGSSEDEITRTGQDTRTHQGSAGGRGLRAAARLASCSPVDVDYA
eukprot:7744572-Pyramimonas_sp.AAC.1